LPYINNVIGIGHQLVDGADGRAVVDEDDFTFVRSQRQVENAVQAFPYHFRWLVIVCQYETDDGFVIVHIMPAKIIVFSFLCKYNKINTRYHRYNDE
jgi:hypothetical protein